MQSLDPCFTPTDRQAMTTKYLDIVYLQLRDKVYSVLKCLKRVALAIDSSIDGTGDPISHIVALANERSLLLQVFIYLLQSYIQVINHGKEQHSAENLFTEVAHVVEQLKKNDIEVTGFVSICNVFRIWSELEVLYDSELKESQFSIYNRLLVSNSLNRRWDLISHNIHAASFLLDRENC